MKKVAILAALALAVPSLAQNAGKPQTWKPVEGKIMTKWAKDVDPKNPWPEYPRPSLVREKWQNLNGLWQYSIVHNEKKTDMEEWGTILVPYPIESALSGVGKRVKHDETLWYMRNFTVPADWRKDGQRVVLHFGAVDWHAKVKINLKPVGEHKGGYDPFSIDITDALKDGENQITVEVQDPTDHGGQPRGKQWTDPHGIWYTPTTGIWQTVWIEPVRGDYRISRIEAVPDAAAGKVKVTPILSGDTKDVMCIVTVKSTGKTFAAPAGQPIEVTIDNPKLWTPETPNLYDITVQATRAKGEAGDTVASYVALRDVKLAKDEHGVHRLFLNGKPVFHFGPLDQGFWPDGLYTPPTEAAMKFDIEAAKKMGCNMLRKHVKVESERFYHACDTMGIMVWQDIPSPFFGDQKFNQPKLTDEWKKNFVTEAKEIVTDFGFHPSIVMWVPWNEGWGQNELPWSKAVVDEVKSWDPSRLVNCASGWTDTGNGDVIDLHIYPGPATGPLQTNRAVVLGEYGGLGLPVPGHTWVNKDNWGYVTYKNKEELTEAYLNQINQIPMLIGEGLAAAIYTQTTDVEIETNGWLTYDREIWKIDPSKAIAATKTLYLPPPTVKVVSQRIGQTTQPLPAGEEWFYSTTKPAGDAWMKDGWKPESGWAKGGPGFGTKGTPGATVGTEWNTSDIWIRRVTSVSGPVTNPHLSIHHDEDAEVYINGELAAKITGYTSGYKVVKVSDRAAAILKSAKSVVISVHCHQTQGGQFIDVGIVDLIPAKR